MEILIIIPTLILVMGMASVTWQKLGRWRYLVAGLQVLPLIWGAWFVDTHGAAITSPNWLAIAAYCAETILIPILAIVTAARLVDVRDSQTGQVRWLDIVLSLVLFILLVSLIGLHIILASIWDIATDGLWALYLSIALISGAVGGAALLAWFLPKSWKLAALAFLLVSVMTVRTTFWYGNYNRDIGWEQLPHQITKARARRIELAIEHYHTDTGSYPAALADLTPRYMLYVPNPYIIRGKTWCYEGGADYYRLGYLNRYYFSSPTVVYMTSSTGTLPDTKLVCP